MAMEAEGTPVSCRVLVAMSATCCTVCGESCAVCGESWAVCEGSCAGQVRDVERNKAAPRKMRMPEDSIWASEEMDADAVVECGGSELAGLRGERVGSGEGEDD